MSDFKNIKYFLNTLNQGNNPGMAISLMKNNELILQEFYGNSDLGKQTKINGQTNFNIASLTKQFTALGILLLEQDGLINVENSVKDILTDAPRLLYDIRVKDLLYHTSGVQDYMDIVPTSEKVLNSQAVNFIYQKNQLNFKPGSTYEYSNSGYVLLAEIIEKVSKKSYPDFIQSRVLNKLNMRNSKIFCPENEFLIENQSVGYSEWPIFDEQYNCPLNYVYGDGGLYSNMIDFIEWIKFLQNPGVLLDDNLSNRIFTSGTFTDKTSINYSYGWIEGEFQNKYKIFHHSGSWLGFKSSIIYIPKLDIYCVLFSNMSGINPYKISTFYINSNH